MLVLENNKIFSTLLSWVLVVGSMFCGIITTAHANEPLAIPPAIPAEGDVWDGTTAKPTNLIQKDGVFFYQIASCEELAYIAKEKGEWMSYNYSLENNLIFNNVEIKWDNYGNCINAEYLKRWNPIEDFEGIFDGNGHIISGIYVNQQEKDNVGLFGRTGHATIKDLSVVNSYLYGNSYVGGIVGYYDIEWNDEKSVFQNCIFDGYVHAYTGNAGGLLGYSSGGESFSHLINYGTVQSDSYAGGIASDSHISYCYNYGDVSYLPGKDNSGKGFGGITAVNSGHSYCFNYGKVTGVTNVGGIFGEAPGGTFDSVNCENKGVVRGKINVGGIAGESCSDGIEACKNSGIVRGEKNVGGIVGHRSSGWYPESFPIENVYNIGTVSGMEYVGGIIGLADDNTYLKSAYNIGRVESSGIAGAILCADNYMWGKTDVYDSFYEKEKTPSLYGCGYSGVTCDSGGIQAKNEWELKQIDTYAEPSSNKNGYRYGWSFCEKNEWDTYGCVWKMVDGINDGYPSLKWENGETQNAITVIVNDNPVFFDQLPIISNGRTLVPVRAISEALGAEVLWNQEAQTITVTKNDIKISLKIGSEQMYVNDSIEMLDVPAEIVNSRTLVPLRAISEAFSCLVKWDNISRTIFITT